MRRMIEDGVTLFVEIGPGRVLGGLIGRIDKQARRVAVQKPNDFAAAPAALCEAQGGEFPRNFRAGHLTRCADRVESAPLPRR